MCDGRSQEREEKQRHEIATQKQMGVSSEAQMGVLVRQFEEQSAALREAKAEVARLTEG